MPTTRWVLLPVLLLALATTTAAGGPVERVFNAPVDRVWTTTEAVLKHLGWNLDKSDRTIGFITTESRRVEGENYGVYEKGTRHRLQLHVKGTGTGRSTVSIERTVFKRERILFVDKDEPLSATDQNVEKAVLDAIGKAL
jgi:uncharacterized lipoprotein